MTSGYAHRDYACSLAEFGRPRELPHCAGWLLDRSIPGTPYRDATGCYPLFACRDWSGLRQDLDELTGLVCVTLVADPFGRYSRAQLQQCFPDCLRVFKEHYVLDLRGDVDRWVRRRARCYARAALRELSVDICDRPENFLDDWLALYHCLIERHRLRGIHVFSPTCFLRQMQVPGFLMLRATYQGAAVGMLSWYVQGEVAYAHLAGVSPLGYELRAAYALYWSAIQYLRGTLHWLDLGGVPGTDGDGHEGLAMFKRGWSSEVRPVYLCGRILDRDGYDQIVRSSGGLANGYFPMYRAGEFGSGDGHA